VESRLPVGERIKYIVPGVEETLPCQLVVAPLHNDLPAAGGISSLGAEPGKPGAVNRRIDDQILARLDVYAYLHQQLRVFRKYSHFFCPLSFFNVQKSGNQYITVRAAIFPKSSRLFL